MGKVTIPISRMPAALDKKVHSQGGVSLYEVEWLSRSNINTKRRVSPSQSELHVASRTRSQSHGELESQATWSIPSVGSAEVNGHRKRWSSDRIPSNGRRRWRLKGGLTYGLRNLSLDVDQLEDHPEESASLRPNQYSLRSRVSDESDVSAADSPPSSPAHSDKVIPSQRLPNSPLRGGVRSKSKRHDNEKTDDEDTLHPSRPRICNSHRRSPLAPLKCGSPSGLRSSLKSSGTNEVPAVIPFRQRRRRPFLLCRRLQVDADGNKADIDARSEILTLANQTEPINWEEFFTFMPKENITHLGDGDFAQAYKCEFGQAASVFKVMSVIDERDSSTHEIIREYSQYLPEVIVSKMVSGLPYDNHNRTNGFIHLNKISVVKGKFPKHLSAIRQKHCYEEDAFAPLSNDQEWLVLEYPYAGEALDKIEKSGLPPTAMRSIVAQVALSLAAGEQAFEMEHRDLHLGNLLIQQERDTRTKLRYRVAKQNYSVVTEGFIATIIDFTLTRVRASNGTTYFVDLAGEEAIDRKLLSEVTHLAVHMKTKELNKDRWDTFNPISNMLWLRFLVQTFLDILDQLSVAERLRQKNDCEAIMSEFHTLLDNMEKEEFNTCSKLINDNFFFDPFRM